MKKFLLLTFSSLTYFAQAQNEAKMVLPIGHTSWLNSATYNAIGSQIVTAAHDRTAKIWDTETGELLQTLKGHTNVIKSAIFNSEGSKLVTTSFKTVKIWDAKTGKLLHTL